jgi:hypothetical protein
MAGTSYTRQSSLTDGDTITASLFNDEYNQLVNAFAYAASGTTGHQHDGGAGEGGNIEIIGDADFKNKIVVDSTNNRWSVFVEVGGTAVEQVRIEDGVVYPVTDSDVDLGTDAARFKAAYIDSITATTSLTLGTSITVSSILDEDDMASNSATALATQQSIKAYVDSQVTAQDLDVTDGTTSISIDLDSEALSVLGGTGIDSTASGNGVTLAIDSTVATLTGSQTLTNKTLTSPDVNTPDIDGGTIDGTIIGGTTAAAGSFTTVGATGNITVGGTVDGRDVAVDGTKLDTIETNADVTDTANVTAAGALMDSEVTNLAQVKAFDSTDYATAAQGTTADAALPRTGGAMTGAITTNSTFDGRDVATDGTKLDGIEAGATADQTDAEIRAAVEAATDSNVFTDADHSKLNAIEALADVTDTANVTAAGALMDSELTNITAVKALNQGVATTDSPTFAGATLTTADINAGTIDGTVIGGSTAAAGTFTTGQFNTSLNVDGTVTADGLVVDSTTGFSWLPVSTAGAEVGVIGTGTGLIIHTPSVNSGYGSGLAIDGSYASSLSSVNIKAFGAKYGSYGSELNLFTSDDTSLLKRQTIAQNGSISFFEDTGTTAKFFWDASAESLGIGTSSPDQSLVVNGQIGLSYDGTNSYQGLKRSGVGTVYYTGTTSTTTDAIHTFTGSSDAVKMTILEGGNVGIGTSSPSSKLTVVGTTKVGEGVASNTSKLMVNTASGTAAGIQLFQDGVESWIIQNPASTTALTFANSGTERLRIDASGNVGIGTSSPDAPLEIDGGSTVNTVLHLTSGTANTYLKLSDSNTTNGGFIGYATEDMFLLTNNTERMRIDSSGNVGIGTSNATPSNGEGLCIGSGSTITRIDMRNTTTGDATGDGTSLQLNGNDFTIENREAGYVAISTSLTERMRIDASGNVGIGTSSPQVKLQVLDTLKVSTADQSSGSVILGDGSSANFNVGIARWNGATNATGAGGVGYFAQGTINSGGHFFYTGDAVAGSTTERMRIDSSGNVKVGSASIQIGYWEADAVHDGYLIPYNGSGQTELVNSFTTGALIFKTGTSKAERMRIDSSGNLLVGKTATAFGTAGVEASASSGLWSTRSGFPALALNRLSTDGSIADFYKDSALVGSIGTNSGLFIGSTYGNDSGIRFASSIIAPSTTTGANSDAAIDLGYDSSRFKDLYLSGGVYLGGTGAANKLDDYETGTWTPTLVGTTSGSATITVTTATYTKVGRQVFVAAYITADLSTHNVVGACQIGGLPFTASSNEMGGGNSPYCQWFTTDLATTSVHFRPLGSSIRLQKGSSSGSFVAGDLGTSAAPIMMLNVTYIA